MIRLGGFAKNLQILQSKKEVQQREDGCKISHSHLNEKLSFEATVICQSCEPTLKPSVTDTISENSGWAADKERALPAGEIGRRRDQAQGTERQLIPRLRHVGEQGQPGPHRHKGKEFQVSFHK